MILLDNFSLPYLRSGRCSHFSGNSHDSLHWSWYYETLTKKPFHRQAGQRAFDFHGLRSNWACSMPNTNRGGLVFSWWFFSLFVYWHPAILGNNILTLQELTHSQTMSHSNVKRHQDASSGLAGNVQWLRGCWRERGLWVCFYTGAFINLLSVIAWVSLSVIDSVIDKLIKILCWYVNPWIDLFDVSSLFESPVY